MKDGTFIPRKNTGDRRPPQHSPKGPRGQLAQTGRAPQRPPGQFLGTKTPALFPQKPPYRPGAKPQLAYEVKPRKSMLPKKPRTASASWGNVATWYDKHLAGADTYHEKVILPNLLRLVDPQKSELILDLAAGQGAATRELAKEGAQLTGLDISPELIAIAQKKGGMGITYRAGSAEDLSVFAGGYFDKAVIVLAIQNIEHVQKVFNEAARVVKHDGTFHVVMNHPAFRIPKRSSWGFDEKTHTQYRRIDQYLSESRETIDMHPGMENSPQTLSFHRPLQYYIKALVKAGFVVDRFEEWISHKDSDSGPRAKAENRARKEIPLFLYLRGRKM